MNYVQVVIDINDPTGDVTVFPPDVDLEPFLRDHYHDHLRDYEAWVDDQDEGDDVEFDDFLWDLGIRVIQTVPFRTRG